MMKFNGKVMKFGNYWGTSGSVTPPGPVIEEVTIGTQTWMAKNLAIDDGQGGIYTQTVNYGQGDVVEYYYTWAAAVRLANTIPGWHLPSSDEWDTLAAAVGGNRTAGTKLKSTYGWTSGNGTDDYGFAAFPAGRRTTDFISLKKVAYFWTTSEYSSAEVLSRSITSGSYTSPNVEQKAYGCSVRLVKDAT